MSRNYIASDYELMIDICKSEINFLKSSWQHMLGRPVVTIALRALHLGIYSHSVPTPLHHVVFNVTKQTFKVAELL